MMKVGCYRFTVVFILAGILPLLGGTLGLGYLVLYAEQPVGYSQYAQGLFGMSVGLMLCGYRSCLYLHQEYGVFVRKMLGFIVREDKFYFSELDEIGRYYGLYKV